VRERNQTREESK